MCVSNDCQNIFISEYVEGTSNNKAIEIYNPTASTITLTSNASIKIYFNGATTATTTISLSGTIPAYGVFVLANSSANATILAEADQTSGSLTFNGDDAIELVFMTASVDVIGQIGVDPGTEWGTGLTSTADNTLRRKASIKLSDSVGSNSFDPDN
ncbi:MAG: lamin tail domain-containing protein [Saprospiraceae bacterium]|nr:lamin tail domain-containing protein [Saprospiraceae bacterium]